jgi:gamma-glutamyltranspeptidase/glutathione hydrolase/leukotriene-C4 hydrolase
LFAPAIDMCFNGYYLSPILAQSITNYESYIRANPALAEVFINTQTNQTYKLGDKIKRLRLGYTLQRIAEGKADAFYRGPLTKYIVQEINENGGNVTEEDFDSYEALVTEAESVELTEDLTLLTTPVPSSGLLVSFIMRLMKVYTYTSGFNFILTSI